MAATEKPGPTGIIGLISGTIATSRQRERVVFDTFVVGVSPSDDDAAGVYSGLLIPSAFIFLYR